MFFDDDDIYFERVRTKRRMQEKEEAILFNFIGAFFKALFGKSNKKKSSKIKNRKSSRKSSKKKKSKNQVQAASLGSSSNSNSNALFLVAIAGVAAASTYIIAKKIYSDKEND